MVDYDDPLIRAVYGFPPLVSSLHALESPEGPRQLMAMDAWQCTRWILAHPGTCCLPWGKAPAKRRRNKTTEKPLYDIQFIGFSFS